MMNQQQTSENDANRQTDAIYHEAGGMSDLVERLRSHKAYNAFTDGPLVIEAAERITALEAENARMREALTPFAERANIYDPAEDDEDSPEWSDSKLLSITVGELRRARSALGASHE